jgi:hypothetical protein
MEKVVSKRKIQKYFNKWIICKIDADILRIKTNKYNKFNTWVVPCLSEAICIPHGGTEFESIIIDGHILLSAYAMKKKIIDLLKIYVDSTNTHLIVPIYFQEQYNISNKDKHDCGISINGKCKIGETYFDAMKREIAEEVGILVDKPAIKSSSNLVSRYKVNENFGIFYARDCRPYYSKDNIEFSNEKDCPSRKIFSYIIGSLDECKLLVHNSRDLYPSSEINYGVAIIPITSVLNPTYISNIISDN